MTCRRSLMLALVLGLLGMIFRLGVWRIAYDADTRLVLRPSLVILYNLFFLLCAGAVALQFFQRTAGAGEARPPYRAAGPVAAALRWASAAAAFAAGGLMCTDLPEDLLHYPVPLICAVLLLVHGAMSLLLGRQGETEGLRYATLLLLPMFTSCFFNVGLYHEIGPEPNPQVYLWPVVALLIATGGWVEYAGFAYLYRQGRAFGLLGLLALMTLPVGMAAPLSLCWRLVLLCQYLWLLSALLDLRFSTTQATIHVMREEIDHEQPGNPEPGNDEPGNHPHPCP